jgi:hypothetical protein
MIAIAWAIVFATVVFSWDWHDFMGKELSSGASTFAGIIGTGSLIMIFVFSFREVIK